MDTDSEPVARVRNVDWRAVMNQCEINDVVCVGVMDQSIRTHIKRGRIKYLDPAKYEVWTVAHEGSRSRALLYMRKKNRDESRQGSE